ncbi:MAG: Na+/H+ antiporter NhaA [Odoribacter sp.]|nr:Na+/H+ antiporter NhaA [Odoribacter sp.]
MQTTKNNSVFKYFIRRFIQTKINSGAILLFMALIAIVIANSPLSGAYNEFLSKEVIFRIGNFNLFEIHGHTMTILELINDALMTIFFFSVGLEIKREVLVGELSSPKKAFLPVIAALGGMVVPIALFALISPSGAAMRGAAIPMATDIAFSLGVLSLLGKKVPLSMKIFLTALAVVDDIGGILVIGLFYSDHLILEYLLYSLIFVGFLFLSSYLGAQSKLLYLFFGVIIWYLFMQSGIHPTIAGVIVAFTIPARPKIDIHNYIRQLKKNIQRFPDENIHTKHILSNSELAVLKHIESSSDKAISPLQSLDDDLQPLVNYIIMPLFAFANANITFNGISVSELGGIPFVVFLSLVTGKLIGIYSFTYIAVKSGFLSLPDRMDFQRLFGLAFLGGVGFTVSLFIANLAYAGVPIIGSTLLNEAKLGIMVGSVFAGVCGYLYLNHILKKPVKKEIS